MAELDGTTLAFVNPPSNVDQGATYFVELDQAKGLKILLKLGPRHSQAALNPDGSIMWVLTYSLGKEGSCECNLPFNQLQ